MEYRYIGTSGLRVTPICLGTMTFGRMATKEEAFKIMDKAYDAGINFFDNAEMYPVPPRADLVGLSEEIMGEWMKSKPRESLIVATKVAGAANGRFAAPVRHGLTAIDRFHIERGIEGTLKRLKTDYVDLYQVHWPDTVVPLEESMEAMDRLVKAGKVRYIGTSNDSTYGLTKANEISKYNKLARFQSIQNNFSLNEPRFFDELAHVCRKEKISLLPYSPLAGGVLTGKYQDGTLPKGSRFNEYKSLNIPRLDAMRNRFINEKTLSTTEKYMQIAKEHDMNITTLAAAWSKQWDFVASTIIGVRTAEQLDDILPALELTLSDEIMDACKKVQQEILYPMG
ncbi:aldo/keto reductase [Arcobacter arenosus]|uniref:aldo/keto reductase n=1 Tax=Arcobacter arenosus TaxID=2576037 RepID=UPI003BA844F9